MAKDQIPPITSKMESAEPKRVGDISLPLNREIRRKYKKLKKKKHFQQALARHGQSVENAEKVLEKQKMDEETKAELLKNLDVQKFLGILNALLTGKKKLVIESKPERTYANGFGAGEVSPAYDISFIHTFRVEDTNANA